MYDLIEDMRKEDPELINKHWPIKKENKNLNIIQINKFKKCVVSGAKSQRNILDAKKSGLPIKTVNTRIKLWVIDCTKLEIQEPAQ